MNSMRPSRSSAAEFITFLPESASAGVTSPADHGNSLSFRGDPFDGRAAARHKRGPFDQIARRVTGDGEFRKQNQARAGAPRL